MKETDQDRARAKILIALKKAKSSLERTIAVIENGADNTCFSVLQQNRAVIGLVQSANQIALDRHVDQVVARISHAKTATRRAQEVDALKKAIALRDRA